MTPRLAAEKKSFSVARSEHCGGYAHIDGVRNLEGPSPTSRSRTRVSLAIALLACASAACSTSAVAALGALQSDDASVLLWNKRGSEIGTHARDYCLTASERERRLLREAVALRAAPAVVTITCPN